MNRKEGSYWVRKGNEWLTAKWIYSTAFQKNVWRCDGSRTADDTSFSEIDERMITREHKFTEHDMLASFSEGVIYGTDPDGGDDDKKVFTDWLTYYMNDKNK